MTGPSHPRALDLLAPLWLLAALAFVLWPFASGQAALAAGWIRPAALLVLVAAVLYGAVLAHGGPPEAALLAAAVGALALPTVLAVVVAPGARLSGAGGLAPWQWTSLVLPDAVADPGWALVHTRDNLVARWLDRASAGDAERRFLLENGLHVGMLPAWLGLAGLVRARGPLAWIARAGVLAGVVVLSGALVPRGDAAPLHDLAPCLLAAGIAVLAGLALSKLRAEGRAPARAGPSIALAVGAVLVTITLVLAALQAGFARDATLLEHAAALLGADAPGPLDPLTAQQNASQIRAVLDRAALASFASLVALLVFLRERGTGSALLVVLVATADLALADASWLGH